ncbi:hypothetical protein [Burkholderia phage FLC6]|nr:hypothetical protein [Burkholderia phage FLC6]
MSEDKKTDVILERPADGTDAVRDDAFVKPSKIADAMFKGTEGVRIELDRVADVTYHGPLGSENIVDKEIDRKVLGDDPKRINHQLMEQPKPVVEVLSGTITPEDQKLGYSWTLKMKVGVDEAGNKEVIHSDSKSTDGLKVVNDELVWPKAVEGTEISESGKVEMNVEFAGGWGTELPPQEQTPEVQTGIPEDKLREVTVPFPADKIREYFQDKSLFFIANYSESKLKGGAFLTYLSNINIPSDVKFNTPIGYDEYAEVMKAYMEQPGVINCAGLHVMAAEMLLFAKGLPYERSPYALPIEAAIVQQFIDSHKEMVDKWLHFIDSTQVFALRSIKALNDFYNPETRFPVVEDRSYVGWNIAQLFRIPEFIAVYFQIEGAQYKLSYFKDQYEEYMFKNETLAKYFQSQNNFAALYFMHYASGLFQPADINHGLFRIGVFDPESEFFEKTPYDFSIQE